ncbi:hypothetical protein [Streptomyces sp. NPDC051286]|uniref:hypothetical protein n=1 Tax=Streptomyces sp. NPDC051286 TaxID=3365647 RepID=UPI0037B663E0
MAALGAALLFDYEVGLIDSYGVGFAKLLCALLAVAAVSVSPWLGTRVLPVVAGLARVASLAVSAALRAGAGGSDGSHAAYGLAEPAALLWLLLFVPLRGRWWWVSCAFRFCGRRSCCGRWRPM